jgi:hypothetical protein
MDYLPYGGLADRAGYCDNLEDALSTVLAGKIAKGFYRIIDHEYGFIGKAAVLDFPANYSADGTFGESIGHVFVTIEIIAGDSEEAITGLDSSRISTYAGEEKLLVAGLWSLMCFYYTGQVFD